MTPDPYDEAMRAWGQRHDNYGVPLPAAQLPPVGVIVDDISSTRPSPEVHEAAWKFWTRTRQGRRTGA